MVSYEDVAPTGLANPETMFLAVGVIIAICFFGFVVWTLYQMLT